MDPKYPIGLLFPELLSSSTCRIRPSEIPLAQHWIVIRRPLDDAEEEFLHERYAGESPDSWNHLHGTLTRIFTGEMEPYYVQWYGFYEGHTAWRVDPLAIARVFGLRSLAELERAYPLHLPDVLRTHHRVPEPGR